MAEETGASVLLKCQYKGLRGKLWNFCYGQDFDMIPGGEPDIEVPTLTRVMTEEYQEGLKTYLGEKVEQVIKAGLAEQQQNAPGPSPGVSFSEFGMNSNSTYMSLKKIHMLCFLNKHYF